MAVISFNRILISALVFLVLSFYSFSDAQSPPKTAGNAKILSDVKDTVPAEVQKLVDTIMASGLMLPNFERDKISMGFDTSTHLSDLKAGKPFPTYKIQVDSLKKYGEKAPFSAFTKRADKWIVPVILHGKCVTTFEIAKWPTTHKWGPGIFSHCSNEWQKVRDAWPDSAGYHPVVLYITPWWGIFYHVPEVDDSNLTPLYRHAYDSLESVIDTSYKILLHKNKTLKYQLANLPSKSTGAEK